MRGPGQPEPRRDVPLPVVRELLEAAADDVEQLASSPPSADRDRRLHTAEQVSLLLRLAADSGARRGELAALHVDDLRVRVLHIDRGISAEAVTTTKTGRSRRVTVGARTAQLWEDTLTVWLTRLPEDEVLGPWLFSADAHHRERLRCRRLGTGSRPSFAATGTPTCACTGSGAPSPPSS